MDVQKFVSSLPIDGVAMRPALLAAAIVLACGPAWAITPREKVCIFSAASKLPAVPGLTIRSSASSPALPATAVSAVLLSFSSIDDASRTLGSTFRLIGADPERVRGHDDQALDYLGKLVTDQLKEAYQVRIDISAAGIDASYDFMCIVGLDRHYYAAMIRVED